MSSGIREHSLQLLEALTAVKSALVKLLNDPKSSPARNLADLAAAAGKVWKVKREMAQAGRDCVISPRWEMWGVAYGRDYNVAAITDSPETNKLGR